MVRQGLIEELQGFDASGKPIERSGGHSAWYIAGLKADQCRNHLQVVLYAVLNLIKQRVLLANSALEFLPLSRRVPPDVDQRGEPESRRSVIIDDDIGINIDNGGFVPRKFDTERTNAIAGFRHGCTQSAFGPIDALAPENAPWLAFNLGRRLPGQFFKFRIGIDDPLAGFPLRHDDRDRHLIEKAPELLALQSVRQIGRGEQPFNLLGLSFFFGHADPGNLLDDVETLPQRPGSNRWLSASLIASKSKGFVMTSSL